MGKGWALVSQPTGDSWMTRSIVVGSSWWRAVLFPFMYWLDELLADSPSSLMGADLIYFLVLVCFLLRFYCVFFLLKNEGTPPKKKVWGLPFKPPSKQLRFFRFADPRRPVVLKGLAHRLLPVSEWTFERLEELIWHEDWSPVVGKKEWRLRGKKGKPWFSIIFL